MGGGRGVDPGGGGGGGSSCIATPGHGCLSPDEFESIRRRTALDLLAAPEFQSEGQWGLRTIDAHEAHAALSVLYGSDARPGTGATVGVIDTGIDLLHPAFQGGAVSETLTTGTPDETGAGFSHGTAVASVVVGRPIREAGRHHTGIAPGATLEMTAIRLGSAVPGVPFSPADLANYDESFLVGLYEDVLSQDLDAVNQSFTVQGLIENYEEAGLRAALGETIEAAAQADRADKTILVWSAGNSHGDLCRPGTSNCVGNEDVDYLGRPAGRLTASSPNLYAGLAARIEELQGHSIVVVAIGEDGGIAGFSNRCGIAADWCIAAPGVAIGVAYFGPSGGEIVREYRLSSGTSFAAPMVTGGLALMKQMFRDQLPNTDLVTRLYATADKSGIYADTAIYGQGLMDLGAAVTPVGAATFTTGARVGDAGHGLRTTHLRLGGALGDGLSRSLAGREIVAFDTLGAPFWYDLPGMVSPISPGPTSRSSVASRLRNLMAPDRDVDATAGGPWWTLGRRGGSIEPSWWRFGPDESPASAESSLLNLAGNAATLTFRARHGLEATAFTTAGLPRQATPATGAVLAWRPSDRPIGMHLGWLGEPEALLGSTADGAFGRLSADSFVAGFEAGTEFAGWHLAVGAEIGLVAPGASGGMIADLPGLTTSALSLRVDRRLTVDDEITISMSQPPRVERGRASLTLPVGRTKDGAVLHESISADLAPSGRQIDLAARWRRAGVFGGEFRTEAYVSHHPGHMDAKPAFGLLAGWRAAF